MSKGNGFPGKVQVALVSKGNGFPSKVRVALVSNGKWVSEHSLDCFGVYAHVISHELTTKNVSY